MRSTKFETWKGAVAGQSVLIAALLLHAGGCTPKPPEHGTAFVVVAGSNQPAQGGQTLPSLDRTEEVLRRRLRQLDVPFFMERDGADRLIIKVPRLGSNHVDLVRKSIAIVGMVEFRMVHPDSLQLVRQGIIEPDYQVLKEQRRHGSRWEEVSYLVKKKPEKGLTSQFISKATVTPDSFTGQPKIMFEFNAKGARLFEDITTEYQPKSGVFHQIAIVFDGKIYAAPRINGVIPGGQAVIEGGFTREEALLLANVLENPAETPHRVMEERTF